MSIHLSVRGQPLEKPLRKNILATVTKINEVVPINFHDLIVFDLDYLNNYVDEKILGPDFSGSLSDIYYNVVGHVPGKTDEVFGGTIYIWVQAKLDRY